MKLDNYIKIEGCNDGHVYRINSRNLEYGIYTNHNNGFLGIRTKFTQRYLFTEYHWDTGAPFGTVCPIEDLGPSPFLLNSEGIEEDVSAQIFSFLDKYFGGKEA